MRIMRIVAAVAAVGFSVVCSAGEVVFKDDFEAPGKWKTNVNGEAKVSLAPGGVSGKCLKCWSNGGMAYYSLELDVDKVRGRTIEARCQVKLADVKVGPREYSTAKLHFGIVPKGGQVQHYANRFLGTADWHEETLKVVVPDNAERVVFDLGIQNGTGTAYFDDFVIEDLYGLAVALDITPAANTSYSDGVAGDGRGGFLDTGNNDLRNVPTGDVELGGTLFKILAPGANDGQTCVVLRGVARPKLPAKPKQPIPVNAKLTELRFLHAAAWLDPKREGPCLYYDVQYADGEKEAIPVREGREIFAFDEPNDLPNCKVAWKGENSAGKTVGLGVFAWRNPRPDVPIKAIMSRSTGGGAVPIVVAVTGVRQMASGR